MAMIRCPKCKNKYEYEGSPSKYCPDCSVREEQQYQIVRTYIKEHQGATVYEVSEALDVPRGKILQYLREERLEVSPSSTTFLSCHACGKAITTGSYCDSCKKRYDTSSTKVIGKVEMEDAQMHLSWNLTKESPTTSGLYKKK